MRELTLPTPLVLLPGLGADAELFEPQFKAFGREMVSVPAWLTPGPDEPFQRYARRFAERLAPTLPERYVLGGTSFGGMLAQELIRFLEPKPSALLLIASARSADAMPTPGVLVGRVLGAMPTSMVRAIQLIGAAPFAKANGGDDDAVSAFIAMAKRHDPALYRWCMRQAAEWEGPVEESASTAVPVFSIHGRQDPVLRCIPELCDHVIPDGKHLIYRTHAKTVNRWVFDKIVSVTPGIDMDYPAIEDPDQTASRRLEPSWS